MATTRKLPKVTEYIKNVGKSVAFSAIEGVKENTPGIKDFLETNEDIFKDVYSSVKNYRQTVRQAERSIKQSNLYQALEYGVKNLIEDAKTGKFYNDRTAEIGESALGMDDFGDDMDISFSDSDSSESDATMASASMLSDSFSTAIGAAATSQNTMVAKGTGMIIQSTKASTKLMMAHMDKNTAMLSSSIGTVYSGIAATNAFLNGPMMAHFENSKRYYEESLRTMDETRAMLKEMLEMQRNMYKSESNSRTEKLDEAMGYDGSMNLSGYLKNIKSNAGAIADSLGLSMLKMDMGGGNPYMLYAAAPFKMILEPMMDRMMSKDFKKALASFDKGLTSMFSQFVARMNTASKREDGSLMSILGKLFGIELSVKESIDTSNYKKDAVPFDGITRQSIIETIPGYLARIEAALTGAGERHYDFKSGSWKSARQIEREFDYKKSSAIRSANYESIMEMEAELAKLEKAQGAKGKKRADSIRKQADKLYKKLFEEGGDFRPQGFKDEFGDVTPAWEYYGFKSEKDFNTWYKTQSKNTQRGFAAGNMRGRNDYARRLREEEEAGGTGRHLFNGAYDMTGAGDGKRHNPSKFLGKASGLLGASADMHGRTVFWYLNEILDKIGSYKRTKKEKKGRTYSRGRSRTTHTSSSTSSSSSSDEGDGSDDPDDGWTDEDEESYSQFLSEEAKRREEEANKNKKLGLGDWITKKFGDSAIGKFFSNAFKGAEKLLSKPMEYMTKMINKADEGIFQMMFGKKEIVDEDGNKISGVFPFMIYKVKETFKKLQEELKKLFNGIKEKLKPLWDKLKEKFKPVTDEVKNMAKQAWEWGKGSVKRTTGKLFNPAMEKMAAVANSVKNGGVTTADEAVDIANNAGDVTTSAYGRVVTKRGLTMISPGEIIIPASFDKREQAKMLAAEKRDRSRIMNAIGLNAKGTVDTEQMKKDLHKIYQENVGSGAKNTASGIMGAGAGLLLGINPLLGAAAGAGLSILKHSETLKTMVFGKEGADGEREGGLLPKKFTDFFKKALPDMGDFGLAGGILGLITPFGPLAGAAVGAGIGMLKNSDGFKRLIFGDEETGEGGFISKETKEKVQKFMKKSAPAAGIGAIAGIFAGPFGLLGNAVLGAGIGMLTSTTQFHDFLFGKADEDGKRSGGLLGALNTGIVEPAKEKITEFLVDFKDFAREHIIKPLKDFWAPFKQDIKNVITGVGDRVKDFLNDTFEKHLGLPIHDFLQEKLFKPLTNTFFKILKAPFTLMKGALAAPAKLLGFIGNNRRAKQIKNGNAYDMTASERLAWREQHGIRMKYGDKTLEEDQLLANMSEEQLRALRDNSRAGLESLEKLQRKKGETRDAVGKEFSKFFNEKVDGKNRYSRVNYSKVKAIVKKLENEGNAEMAAEEINKLEGLTPEEKKKLIENVTQKIEEARTAADIYEKAKSGSKATDAVLEKILGRKINGRKDRRQIERIAEVELKAKEKANKADAKEEKKAEETADEANKATLELKDLYKEKSDLMIKHLETAAKALEKLSDSGLDNLDEDDIDKKMFRRKAVQLPWKHRLKVAGKIGKSLKDGVVSAEDAEALEDEVLKRYGVNPDGSEDGVDTNAYGSTYIRKHGLTMISPGEIIIGRGRKHRKKYSGFIDLNAEGDVHEDSKEAVDARKKAEEEASDEKTANQAERESAGWLKKLHDKFFGDKEKKKDKEGTGILSKIGSGIGTIFSWFTGGSGILGKIGLGAAALGGASLFGYATDWFKDKVLPGLKTLLFGDPKDPNDGLWGKFKQTKVGTALDNLVTDIKDNGGIGGWMANVAIPKVIDKLVVGWGYAMENIVAPLTVAILKNLPQLLVSTVKALVSGLAKAVFNKEIERDEASGKMTADTSGLAADLAKVNSNTSSHVSSDVKKALGTTIEATTGSGSASWDFNSSSLDSNNVAADQTYDAEGNHLNKTGEEVLFKDQSKISELLFGKQLTNDIYYDENGNIGLNHYYTNNTSDSLVSKTVKATGRSFLHGLLGRGKNFLSNLGNMSAKGVGKGWVKAGTTGAKATGKAAGKLFGGAHDLGSKIFGNITNAGQADELVTQLVKDSGLTGKDATALYGELSEKIAKNGVEGVQEAFKQYGTSEEALTKAIALEDVIKNAAETGTKKGKIATAIDGLKDKFGKTKVGAFFNRKNETKEFADAVAAATGKKGKKADKLSKKIQKQIKWNGTKGIDDALDLASTKTGKKVTNEMLDDVLEKGVKLTDTVTKAPTLRSTAKSKVMGVVDKATDALKSSKAGKAVTGAVNTAKEAVTSSKAGKTAAKVADTVKDVASKGKGLIDDICKKIVSFFDEIATNSKILGFLKKAAKAGTSDNVIIKALKEIGEKLGKTAIAKAAKGALQKIASAVAKYIPYVNIAFYVADFISGYNNAYTILGVAKGDTYKVNFGQKCLCGLLNLITANLTLGLVPNEIVVDLIVDVLFPIFGLDAKELKAARENADNVLDEWNKAHPEETYSNLEDFNKKDSLWNKMKKGTKKAWNWTKDAVKDVATKAGEGIKNVASKVGEKAKEIGSDIVDGAKDALNKGKELVSGAFDKAKNAASKVKDTVKSLANTAKEEGIGEAAKELANKAKDVAKDTIDKAKEALNDVGSSVKDGLSKAKDWFGGLFGKGRNVGGSGSHAYQSDSMIANMRYGNSTIKDSGCAPVLATNLINSVRPGSMSVMEAAKFAESNNFTASGGTDSKYFNKFLAGHGINTVDTKNKDAIVSAIRRGNQVIMLGQDSSDGPGTPFGRNPHFITVKGMRGGQFVVEDPSFEQGSVVYNKDKVLNSMKHSIITSTSMIKPEKTKRGRGRYIGGRHVVGTTTVAMADGGSGSTTSTSTDTTATAAENTTDTTATGETTNEKTTTNLMTALGNLGTSVLKAMFGSAYDVMFGDSEETANGTSTSSSTRSSTSAASVSGIKLTGNDNAQKIWNFLREKGYSKAGAAGLMGNLYAESGFQPNNIENQYEGKYGDDAAYTSKVDDKSYGKEAFSRDAAGYGLAQWTYHTRKGGLYDTTVGQGLSVADLAGQLAYLDKELQGYSALYKTLKNTTSVDTASDQVLTDFERPAVLNYDTRRAYSQSVYDQYGSAAASTTTNTGTATKALNTPRAVSVYERGRNAEHISAYGRNYVGGAGRESGVDYATFLQTIVSILLEIGSNTAILSKILDLLAKQFDLSIDKAEVQAAAQASSQAQMKAMLDNIVKQSGSSSNLTKMINSHDTDYVFAAMAEIAKE